MDAPSAPRSAARSAARKSSGARPRELRHQALADARRRSVLDAARAAFFELGMEKTSMREIAQRAGYTVGALYSYFASKEEVYGALLAESLERLNARVRQAVEGCADEARRARRSATAFFDFYRENPRDLDLGFYLFQGMTPRGLTPELNEKLNARLRDALQPTQNALKALGLPARKALEEVTALFAHTVGLLVLSHTGRIRMFRQASQDLFDAYLRQLLARAGAGQEA
ncbi:TetR/AcrR family transcriptional regulator [Piscinibacter sp.]|uniref:TetR/AcrR family transcriptional regulator n=1 Tax=Piscinibacter sp. TaxID=1903157 RepID=UPI0039E644AD